MRKPRKKVPSSSPGAMCTIGICKPPSAGHLKIVFLSEVCSMLTHWQGRGNSGRSVACPGADLCPPATHRLQQRWFGYAAVEVYRGDPYKDWLPSVLEVTERLDDFLTAEPLRGTVWSIYRQVAPGGIEEFAAQQIGVEEAEKLRTDIDVVGFVERLYRTKEIAWGAERPFATRQLVEPRKADSEPSPAVTAAAEETAASSYDGRFGKAADEINRRGRTFPNLNGKCPGGVR